MSNQLSLDLVQEVFTHLAASKGIPFHELANGWDEEKECLKWNLDYKNSLQKEVFSEKEKMLGYFELHQSAIKNNDLVTAQVGLIRAATFARSLASTFEYIHDECYKVLRDDPRFQWPEIPENYQIPDQYKEIFSK